MLIPSEQFKWDGSKKWFIAECSDLYSYGFRNNIPKMFEIRGLRRKIMFRLSEIVRNDEEEVLVWIFKPATYSADTVGVEVHILND